ncbi:hypothetical protein [Herbidospora mongoliensis]|uniref:hypothetical protein n=1 Tax=Herbidospora mongoliensis TaxID=688067 RepID=UPI0008355625|nr:hypothetical protein [Herbidospora mongoliensis]
MGENGRYQGSWAEEDLDRNRRELRDISRRSPSLAEAEEDDDEPPAEQEILPGKRRILWRRGGT